LYAALDKIGRGIHPGRERRYARRAYRQRREERRY
jgi:hypothetical protein